MVVPPTKVVVLAVTPVLIIHLLAVATDSVLAVDGWFVVSLLVLIWLQLVGASNARNPS